MRRFAFLIAPVLFLATGCDTAGPVEPSASAPSAVSATTQNDSTPAAAASEEAPEGGILIGSGT